MRITDTIRQLLRAGKNAQKSGNMWPPIYLSDGTIRKGPNAAIVGRWRE